MSVATIAQLTAYIPGLEGNDLDAELAAVLVAAEGDLAGACGWPVADDGSQGFSTATYTLHPRPSTAEPRLLPLAIPGAAIQSVTSAWSTWTDTYDSSTLLSSGSYTVDNAGLWLLSSATLTWSTARRGVRVVLVAGWAEGDAPPSVVSAVLAQAKHRWLTLRNAQDVPQMTQAGTSVTRRASDAVSPVALGLIRTSVAHRWSSALG